MHFDIFVGPVDWNWRRFQEECRWGEVFETHYVTLGRFHIFFSRKIKEGNRRTVQH